MRITTRISGAGDSGLSRIPFLDVRSIDAELCTDGHLDEAKCRRVLNNPDDGIQIASTDTLPVFAFALELLKQVRDACNQLIENRRDGNSKDAHAEAETADDRHAQRNMKRGRVVYVRTDITYSNSTGALKLRVNIDNPNNVVGVAERIALDYALILARVANSIQQQLTAAHGDWRFEFIGGEGCPTLFEDALMIDKNLELQRKREKCERRRGEYCSPMCPDCELYKNGKCMEAKK